MRRRLELACGLVNHPRLLFLDEPTLGLDVQTRAAVWSYIRRLKEEYGMTLFMTTHYLEEADNLCERIAIIDHGRIVKIGSPNQLKVQPSQHHSRQDHVHFGLASQYNLGGIFHKVSTKNLVCSFFS